MPGEALRIVVVTMDSVLAHAASAAEAELRRDVPGLRLEVHAADEWGTDPAALEACLDAIGSGDIVIGTMLFLDEHIRAVLPAMQARREACDAMLGCLSAPEIVRLTRLGSFSMGGGGAGMALLRRLRGNRGKGGGGTSSGGASSGRDQMKMLRRLPKLLRFVPGAAQDARCYFLAMQYWLAGSESNLLNLVRMLVERYAAGPRRLSAGTVRAADPVHYPEVGLYHPGLPGGVAEDVAELPGPMRGAAHRGTVGLLLMRSYVLAGNAAHYDGVIEALEARGLRVIPAFAAGLDARPAIERFFIRDDAPVIDALLSLTGFSLVGGPAYNDAGAAEAILARLDVPYVAAHPVEFQTLEQWDADPRGLMPVEAAMMVALPELDGAIWPMTFGGRSHAAEGTHRRQMATHGERASTLAGRVAKLVALRRSARAERRVAVVLFNFPPNGGSTGTAAFLSVFESLHRTLGAMREAGYDVDVPADVAALRARVLEGNAGRFGAAANVAHRIPAGEHVKRERHLREIEAQWGPAPGRQNSDGSTIHVLGERFGNVFVGIQPAFGYEGDPMRLLFEHGFAPTHAFSAFYRWLREDFRAHAVLHFGTHGALEFMPGKHAGLSAACWPDRLIGDLPNVYLYACNNPSEGALAKRRAGAVLVSYLTPPLGRAGLYRGLLDLRGSIDRWRGLEPEADLDGRNSLAELIRAQAETVELTVADWDDTGGAVERIRLALLDLEQTLIPHGLHVVGAQLPEAVRAEMIDAAGIADPEQRAAMDATLAAETELPGLLRALDGRYVRPAPGGDLLRTPEVLPTGRNLHGIDPFRIPSAFAVEDGARQAERLLARHGQDGHGQPETVAMVLWGTDNLKTEGGPIAQALWLMGAEPRRDSYGRLAGAQLVPLDRLGRARVDVVLTLSGIFRDLLPMQVRLLAEAALLAARAQDEPEAMNPIRRHALAYLAQHGGDLQTAALRVFGNAEDAYGGTVNQLVDTGAWNDEDELADAFLRRKGFAYGVTGIAQKRPDVLAHVLRDVSVAYQNLDSIELGVTTVDHYFDTLGGLARAARRERGGTAAQVYIGDQTRGDGLVRSLSEQVTLETRTRALNPKWYEALLEHGYEGVRQIEAHVTNTLGWSATTGEVAPWIYQQLSETFVLEPAMRDRLAALNPAASAKIVGRLIEASERRYWAPEQAVLDGLRRASEAIEDRLEGIIPIGAAA